MKKLALLISATLLASHAYAGDTYIRNGNIYTHEGSWIVGAGAAYSNDLYKGQDKNWAPMLNFGYHGEDFNADFGGVNYRFFGNNDDLLNLSAYLGTSGLMYEAKDADVLKGMSDRKLSLDMGLNADVKLGDGTVSTFYQHDVSGRYKGFLTGVKYAHVIELGSVDFVPFAGVTYQSKDYVDYYFGVRDKEQTATRKAYKGDGTFSYGAGYQLVVPITKNLEVTQSAAYSRLGSEISDSPLVDSKNQWAVGAMVNYHF